MKPQFSPHPGYYNLSQLQFLYKDPSPIVAGRCFKHVSCWKTLEPEHHFEMKKQIHMNYIILQFWVPYRFSEMYGIGERYVVEIFMELKYYMPAFNLFLRSE